MTEKIVLAQNRALTAEAGEDIGLELGMKLVKDYYDATGDKTNHFVGKNILIKLLSQPDCVGVRIYKALNEESKQTYVLVGIDSKGEAILEFQAINVDGELSKELGIVADRTIGNKGWADLL